MILIIDNYDSFTYNLVHLVAQNVARTVAQLGTDNASAAPHENNSSVKTGLIVRRNDKITLSEIEALKPAGILISPGPGRPSDAGITCDVIQELGQHIPILGVCLGHQAIGEVFGGTVTYAPTLMHGKTSLIEHDNRTIFGGLSQGFVATRYHSLVVAEHDLPACLEVSARTPDDVIMGLRHSSLPIEGIQFHPESLLTVEGPTIIANWVRSLGIPAA